MSPAGVASVHNQWGVLDQKPVVDGVVICRDENCIEASQSFRMKSRYVSLILTCENASTQAGRRNSLGLSPRQLVFVEALEIPVDALAIDGGAVISFAEDMPMKIPVVEADIEPIIACLG